MLGRAGLGQLLQHARRRRGGVRSRSLFVALDEPVTPALSAVRQFKVGGRVSAGGYPSFEGPSCRRVPRGELAFGIELFGPVRWHRRASSWTTRAIQRLLRRA